MTKIKEKTDIFALAVVQWENCTELGYCNLVDAVRNLHLQSHQAAVKAINRYATMRNWLIGFFIVEYQQKGKDRAVYGERLLKRLEESLNTRGLNVTLFQNCRLFYTCYPQVADLFQLKIQPTVLAKLESAEGQKRIQPTASVELRTRYLTHCEHRKESTSSILELVRREGTRNVKMQETSATELMSGVV